MTARSTLVRTGDGIPTGSLDLDGALEIRAAPGATVTVKRLAVRNGGHSFELLDDVEEAEEALKIRGFRCVREFGPGDCSRRGSGVRSATMRRAWLGAGQLVMDAQVYVVCSAGAGWQICAESARRWRICAGACVRPRHSSAGGGAQTGAAARPSTSMIATLLSTVWRLLRDLSAYASPTDLLRMAMGVWKLSMMVLMKSIVASYSSEHPGSL